MPRRNLLPLPLVFRPLLGLGLGWREMVELPQLQLHDRKVRRNAAVSPRCSGAPTWTRSSGAGSDASSSSSKSIVSTTGTEATTNTPKGMELVAHSLVCPPLTPELRQRGLRGSVRAGGSRTDELVPVDHLHRLALLVQLVLRHLPLVLLRRVAQSLPCGPINSTGR